MYDVILFDLDGTLIDPKEGITKSVQYALSECGIIEEDTNNLLDFIGPPLVNSFCDFYNMTEEQAWFAIGKYRERFGKKGVYESTLYDGVEEMLKALKLANKKIAIATSKPEPYAKTILENYKLDGYFDVICGCEFNGERNTKTEVIVEALKRLGNPELSKTVMIGDRKHDVEGANNCGLDAIGLRLGYAKENELEKAGAKYIVDDIFSLKDFLLK